MKKTILSLLVLSSCFTRSTVVNRDAYDSVNLGDSVTSVEKKIGNPYQVRKYKDGTELFEYIERIYAVENEIIEENHYFFWIKNGQVVSKKITNQRQSNFDLIDDDDPNNTELQ
ncbi:MAG: hypothetical protein JSR58_02255 [Verrucomicrobia bacterium]|nr:hypothetical protein [Verrucomicrobiota bacterium]